MLLLKDGGCALALKVHALRPIRVPSSGRPYSSSRESALSGAVVGWLRGCTLRSLAAGDVSGVQSLRTRPLRLMQRNARRLASVCDATLRRWQTACVRCHGSRAARSLDVQETAKFEADAHRWWDTQRGPFAPLHAMNPVRCAFIRTELCRHFSRDERSPAPLEGLHLLDVGCGGGILVEPLARMGATVLGVDAVARSVAAARAHAARDPVVRTRARYRAALAEELLAEGLRFDAVLSLEVVEHCADVHAFTSTLADLVAPRGMLVMSTVHRTLRSYALGILAAERVLGLVPAGTHEWSRFVTPDELAGALLRSGFKLEQLAGMVYSPLTRKWRLSTDTAVNYICSATRAEPPPVGSGASRDVART